MSLPTSASLPLDLILYSFVSFPSLCIVRFSSTMLDRSRLAFRKRIPDQRAHGALHHYYADNLKNKMDTGLDKSPKTKCSVQFKMAVHTKSKSDISCQAAIYGPTYLLLLAVMPIFTEIHASRAVYPPVVGPLGS